MPYRQYTFTTGNIAYIRTNPSAGGHTNHPCIILDQEKDYFLVTPVSAFGLSEGDGRVPWKKFRHLNPDHFWAFADSARPQGPGLLERPFLQLQANQSFPKTSTSWVNASSIHIIHKNDLARFNKVEGIMMMTDESLEGLQTHICTIPANKAIIKQFWGFNDPVAEPTPAPLPAAQVGQIQDLEGEATNAAQNTPPKPTWTSIAALPCGA